MTSRIEWTERTWEPVLGCSRVSPGCENCYAERLTWRLAHNPGTLRRYLGLTQRLGGRPPRWTGEVHLDESVLGAPLRWHKPSRIFVCSRSDLFHESVPFEFLDRVYGIMALCPQHTFQVLTKRPERRRAYFESFNSPEAESRGWHFAEWLGGLVGQERLEHAVDQVLAWHKARRPNVWEGTTAEDQRRANERIPELLATPAALRFVSVEPMLGSVDLRPWLGGECRHPDEYGHRELDTNAWICQRCDEDPTLDWVIVGGESGPGARPCDVEWIRDVVRRCRDAGAACFVKQLGAAPTDSAPVTGPTELARRLVETHRDLYPWRPRDRKGGDPSEWPADLRVREWPEVAS